MGATLVRPLWRSVGVCLADIAGLELGTAREADRRARSWSSAPSTSPELSVGRDSGGLADTGGFDTRESKNAVVQDHRRKQNGAR
jgi:hypothetical protein